LNLFVGDDCKIIEMFSLFLAVAIFGVTMLMFFSTGWDFIDFLDFSNFAVV
jgi:hypothetical protein